MQWEFRILDFFRKHHNSFFDRIMHFFSRIGNVGFVWHLISLLLVLAESTRLCGLCTFAGAMIASGFANLVVKPLANRARPFEQRPDVGMLVKRRPHGSSFPSGHATTSFGGAVGGTLGMLWTLGTVAAVWFAVFAFALAALISFSRIYLYVHFPTDVIVGVAIGTGFGFAVPYGVFYLYGMMLTLSV